MKIDQDLRAAIRSAEKVQPNSNVDKWQLREEAAAEAIADFLKRYPSKAKKVHALVAAMRKAAKAQKVAEESLCEQFGLRHYDNKLQFARCGAGSGAFEKAGGKVPPPVVKGEPWKYDRVMAELAAAEPKQLKAILKKYGINWS